MTTRPALSQRYRPSGGSGCARRRLCQGAGHVSHEEHAGSGLLRRAQARTFLDRTVARGTEAAAGPHRAQRGQKRFVEAMDREFNKAGELDKRVPVEGRTHTLGHGDVVIAAITSCTNTSNPSVMIAGWPVGEEGGGAGAGGQPLVKTSLAPGSQVVAEYYEKSGSAEIARRAPGLNLVCRLRLRWLIEGEEEVSSPHLAPVVRAHAAGLQADWCAWENGSRNEADQPIIICGQKGLLYVELRATGPRPRRPFPRRRHRAQPGLAAGPGPGHHPGRDEQHHPRRSRRARRPAERRRPGRR